MEGEQRHYELRSGSRSRSRTPLIPSRDSIEPEIADHRYDLRLRCREGSHMASDPVHRARIVDGSETSDQSLGIITETGEEEVAAVEAMPEGADKQAENAFAGARKLERRSERQKAKKHAFTNGQTDVNEISTTRKAGKSSKNASPRKVLTSDYSSEEGERGDSSNGPSSAHEIYRQAGDWWNVFPKTDYTYSERSQCRYEIAPGILAMPNMSRRSIHSNPDDSNQFHHTRGPSDSGSYEIMSTAQGKEGNAESATRVDAYRGPETASFDEKSQLLYTETRAEQRRFHSRDTVYAVSQNMANSALRQRLSFGTSVKRCGSREYDVATSVDSDTEAEDAVSTYPNRTRRLARRFTGFTSVVASWLRRLYESVRFEAIKRSDRRISGAYRRHESTWFRAWRYLDRFFQYIYLFMVKVFFFDSWLLSRASGVRGWIRQRSSKVLWIALLPLLLLAGCRCLPYAWMLFHPSKVAIPSYSAGAQLSASEWETDDTGDDLASIIDILRSKISSLEDRTVEHSNRLANVSTLLEQLRETDHVWAKYDNEISLLEKGLAGQRFTDRYSQQVDDIKSQLEKLRESCSEAISCCRARDVHATSEDLQNRIELILRDQADAPPRRRRVEAKERAPGNGVGGGVTDERVREIVKEALRVYDADKTGRVDYALESAGGQVISTRCTQRYDVNTRAFKLLAFTLYHENNDPRTAIQGNPIQPGACWAFQGFPGYLLIKLRGPIRVTGFTLEHAPKSILPNGEMKSAPKMFNVWGFADENDPEPVMYGDYEFAASDDSLQYFPVQNTTIKTSHEYVELRIHSNHGQLEYTCLYRFRVHGKSV